MATRKRTPAQTLRKLAADARIQDFIGWCRRNGIKEPVFEYLFYPNRKWRFDFCWVDEKIALENQGGLFSGGRHTRGASLLKEHEKLNAAAEMGWRILYATPQTLKSRETLTLLRRVLP